MAESSPRIPLFLRLFIRPLAKFLHSPKIRYSADFQYFQEMFTYDVREQILQLSMHLTSMSRLEGDYLEFGVASGKTFVKAYHFAQKYGLASMKFYAFDSFQGLPEITGVDAQGFRHFEKGEYAHSQKAFLKYTTNLGVNAKKIALVPGWFDKSLTSSKTKAIFSGKSAAVVWIDCDLYESTVPVLKFLTPLVQDGTMLIFDDWYCYRGSPQRGERKAFTEWLAQNKHITVTEFRKFGSHGNSFIVHLDEPQTSKKA